MKKFKMYGIKNRVAALVLVGTMAVSSVTLASCSKKSDDKSLDGTQETTSSVYVRKSTVQDLVPEMGEEAAKNAEIILLLDKYAKKDENGKINADEISKEKAKLDIDNMINDFNSFLDLLQQRMIIEGKVVRVSGVNDLNATDKKSLSSIESALGAVMEVSKVNDETLVQEAFASLANEIESVDLSLPGKAVANMYGEVGLYYARNYISDETIDEMDKRLDDQNNKAAIHETLAVVGNLMDEKSVIDVKKAFEDKYTEVEDLLNGKVSVEKETIKNLVNYINLRYLNSDQVSTNDKNDVLGDYSDEKVRDVLLAVDAITEYNFNNSQNLIPFRVFIIDEYAKTDTGKLDAVTFDFVQFNSNKLNETKDSMSTLIEPRNNPYFANEFKFFTKDNFTHVKSDGEVNVIWQNVSNGNKLISDEVVLYTLGKLPEFINLDSYKEKAQMNLNEMGAELEKTITGECDLGGYQLVK